MALVRRVLMQLLLVAPSSCLRVPTVSRREAVRLAAASATTIPLVANAVPQYVVPIQDDLRILIIKAKELRTAVRNGASARRSLPLDPTPGVNNYEALTNKVLRAKVATLEPLRAQFKAVAADAGAKSLLDFGPAERGKIIGQNENKNRRRNGRGMVELLAAARLSVCFCFDEKKENA